MEIDLFGPGMTAMHKVGLAGLWMTLEALERSAGGQALRSCGSWTRSSTKVALTWSGDGRAFFETLFREAFKVDSQGLIWFEALGTPSANPGAAVVLQESLLGSFLQHNKSRESLGKNQGADGNLAVDVDGEVHVFRFRKVGGYAHQRADFQSSELIRVVGWLYPGSVVRHEAFNAATSMKEPPERALALRFAPVGAIYFQIWLAGEFRPRHAIVLPEINDLERYANLRRAFVRHGIKRFQAGGVAEAAYRVLAEFETAKMLDDMDLRFCRVILFGTTPWAKQQKTRTSAMTVHAPSKEALRVFALYDAMTQPCVFDQEDDSYWSVSPVPDMIARNLSGRNPWWTGFGEIAADKTVWDHIAKNERRALAKMIEDREGSTLGGSAERAFVRACHEAWRRRLGQIGEKAQREGSSFEDQAAREFERLRVQFSRCKNAATVREVITDFWARAGSGSSLKSLRASWEDVLTLLDEKNWRKAKDLALLALASYESVAEDESASSDGVPQERSSIEEKGAGPK